MADLVGAAFFVPHPIGVSSTQPGHRKAEEGGEKKGRETMGVPAFYRWLSEKYPKIVVDMLEDRPVRVEGTEIPLDLTAENPNGIEVSLRFPTSCPGPHPPTAVGKTLLPLSYSWRSGGDGMFASAGS